MSHPTPPLDIRITPILPSPSSQDPQQQQQQQQHQLYRALYTVAASAFGGQTQDLVWRAFNPGWDTPEGVEQGAARIRRRVVEGSKMVRCAGEGEGGAGCVVVAASVGVGVAAGEDGAGDWAEEVVELEGERRRVVGVAIWVQQTAVEGYGDLVPRGELGFEERGEQLGVGELWPGDEDRQRWLVSVDAGLHGRRWGVVREKAKGWEGEGKTPAAWVLDLCAVRPRWQGKGVAGKLVKWGVEEAERRGGLECLTEGSKMGRGVYVKYGMEMAGEIDYGEGLGEQEKRTLGRYGELPSNVFMRSWKE